MKKIIGGYMEFLNFGEVLFDVFPDKATLGGAPLNSAVHMTRLGMKGTLISAVGKDALGEEALNEIRSYGLSPDDIAVLDKETGKAVITLTNGNADYTFNEDNAWDNIPLPGNLPSRVDVIYFGTLAQRAQVSRDTLFYILDNIKSDEVFFDVNIRKHYYSDEIIRNGLERATILKLNDEEVDTILKSVGIDKIGLEGLERLKEEYSLNLILLTLGSHGSMCLGERWYRKEPEAALVVDTVGAGDSLSAGFLSSYLKDHDIEKALEKGTKLASFVVSRRGAIPEYNPSELHL